MEPVSREDLQSGKEYYIECLTYGADEVTMIPNPNRYRLIATFEKLAATPESDDFKFAFFKYFREVNRADAFIGRDVNLNLLWRFYEVKKYKIQRDMENRALNMVLRRIVGDEYFHCVFC
jgi:hypothetical protein